MADLKPCPFCGSEAELWVPGGPIRCVNPDCEAEAPSAEVWKQRWPNEAQQGYTMRRWIAVMETGVARMTQKQRETGEQVLTEMREALSNAGVMVDAPAFGVRWSNSGYVVYRKDGGGTLLPEQVEALVNAAGVPGTLKEADRG